MDKRKPVPVPLNYGLTGDDDDKKPKAVPLNYGLTGDNKETAETKGPVPVPLNYGLGPRVAGPTEHEAPFEAKHPNISAAGKAAVQTGKDVVKMFVPWVKYIDPEERERFMKLTQQKQTRELLLQDLEAVAMLGAGPIAKGAKGILAAKFPKTFAKVAEVYGKLNKPIGKAAGVVDDAIKPLTTGVADEAVSGGRGSTISGEPIPEVGADDPVAKVVAAIKEAKPIRGEQEAIYTKIRGERINKAKAVGEKVPGEEGYYAKLSQMKGEMDRVQFDSIRKQVGQEDIDALFSKINESGGIDEFEKLTAGRGLAKMFGEFGGTVPTKSELSILENVFGKDMVDTLLSKRSLFDKAKNAGLEIANIPRSLMTSFDVSAPLRQGIFLIGRPKQFAPAVKDMFKYLFSEKSYQGLIENIAKRPTYQAMKDSGLAITEMGGNLAAREEQFMSSWAEKIPGIGRGVRASGRAYTGFLNKLRADVFDDIVKTGTDLGITDPKFLKDTASFINNATGRGGLGELEKSAAILNATLFSPRLLSSRLTMLNPVYYAKLHPQVRKEALKSLFTFAGTATTVASIAALNGATVGTDPRSADFMKLKFGNSRFDILGGFQQPIRTAAQLITGQLVSSTTGKIMTVGEGYKPMTRLDIAARFVESKFSPIASFSMALMRGQTNTGEKVDIPTEVANRFVPMVIQDMNDLYKERGATGLPMALPALLGVGSQTYGGVSSFGLNGKDHQKLNTELNRLKTSMGYPSTIAFGQDLTNKEYKQLKEKTGKEVAKRLDDFISSDGYKDLDDRVKLKMIERNVDMVKERVKKQMFPNKQIRSKLVSAFKAQLMTDEEAKKAADEFMKKRNIGSK